VKKVHTSQSIVEQCDEHYLNTHQLNSNQKPGFIKSPSFDAFYDNN